MSISSALHRRGAVSWTVPFGRLSLTLAVPLGDEPVRYFELADADENASAAVAAPWADVKIGHGSYSRSSATTSCVASAAKAAAMVGSSSAAEAASRGRTHSG